MILPLFPVLEYSPLKYLSKIEANLIHIGKSLRSKDIFRLQQGCAENLRPLFVTVPIIHLAFSAEQQYQ